MLNRSQASRCQQAFSKSCLVNLISKDTQLVFSIYTAHKNITEMPELCEPHSGLSKSHKEQISVPLARRHLNDTSKTWN